MDFCGYFFSFLSPPPPHFFSFFDKEFSAASKSMRKSWPFLSPRVGGLPERDCIEFKVLWVGVFFFRLIKNRCLEVLF